MITKKCNMVIQLHVQGCIMNIKHNRFAPSKSIEAWTKSKRLAVRHHKKAFKVSIFGHDVGSSISDYLCQIIDH